MFFWKRLKGREGSYPIQKLIAEFLYSEQYMTKLLMLVLLSFIKPSLEICLVTKKKEIVTLRLLAGLAVPGCKGLSTMIRRPTYAVLWRVTPTREGG